MATSAPVVVGLEVMELSASLTDGTKYLAQNVGQYPIRFATKSSAPGIDEASGWHFLPVHDWVEFTPSATARVWVRAVLDKSRLVISEG